MLKKTAISILITLLVPIATFAVGVSVIPSKLLIQTQVNQITKQNLQIKNPSSVVSIYDLSPDDYSDWLKILPSSFTLEAGESRAVELQVKSPSIGSFATQISVVAKPLSPRAFQANSGVKIPLEIRVEKVESSSNSLANFVNSLIFSRFIFALDLLLFLIVVFILISKTLSKKNPPLFYK